MKIAIIGAGISGLMSALELVEQGCSVIIFDQKSAGKAASWAGGGILSPMYPWRYDPAVNLLARHGKSLYIEWNQKLKAVSGIDFEIQETGMMIFDEADFEQGFNYAQKFQEPMQECHYLHQKQIKHINPLISTQFQHALYFPQIANIRNPRLLQSITRYLKQHPQVELIENCCIHQLNKVNGKIQSVTDQNYQHYFADHFVISTGAWSQMWSAQLDIEIPIRPIQGQMVLFKTPQNWLPSMCMNKVMYLIPRADGHVVCGSSMSNCGFDITPDARTQQTILDACFEMVPELTKYPIVKQWAGLRPSSPHGVPYIGKIPNINNLWANFGHFRNGLCMGPASARLLRQLILNQPTLVDPALYSAERLNTDLLAMP